MSLPSDEITVLREQPANERPTTAVVPAAGFGTRLKPLTLGIPKEMLPVGGALVLARIVTELEAVGITRIIFVLSESKQDIVRRYFGAKQNGICFEYVLQHEMRGLGDAVSCAAPLLHDSHFLVALGDAVFEEPVPGTLTNRLVESCLSSGSEIGIVVQRVAPESISRYGVVQPVGAAGTIPADAPFLRINDVVEKPAPQNAPSDLAVAARYLVPHALLQVLKEVLPGVNNEIQLTDALRVLLRAGYAAVAVPLKKGEARHDIGNLESYFRAFTTFALADPEQGESFRNWLKSRILSNEEKPLA